MDTTTRASYRAALKKAEAELAGHEKRGETLRQTVDGLRGLLAGGATAAAPAAPKKRTVRKRKQPVRRRRRTIGKSDHPQVTPNFFKGLGPTAAYRKFVSEYGADHPVPAIRDTLLQGGVRSKSSTSLLTGLHSIRRRDNMKAELEGGAGDGKKGS